MSITFAGVGDDVVLINPILGDSLWTDTAGVLRYTRGLVPLPIYGGWKQRTRFSVTWRWLASDDVDDLFTFLQANLGLTIIYTDYRGDANNVIILTPEAADVHEGRDTYNANLDSCSSGGGQHNISLELEVI